MCVDLVAPVASLLEEKLCVIVCPDQRLVLAEFGRDPGWIALDWCCNNCATWGPFELWTECHFFVILLTHGCHAGDSWGRWGWCCSLGLGVGALSLPLACGIGPVQMAFI